MECGGRAKRRHHFRTGDSRTQPKRCGASLPAASQRDRISDFSSAVAFFGEKSTRSRYVIRGISEIVLTTLNAKYIHAAFGLRYLLANLDELRPRAAPAEFDINQQPLDIAEKLLALEPKIIGFGVYIDRSSGSLSLCC